MNNSSNYKNHLLQDHNNSNTNPPFNNQNSNHPNMAYSDYNQINPIQNNYNPNQQANLNYPHENNHNNIMNNNQFQNFQQDVPQNNYPTQDFLENNNYNVNHQNEVIKTNVIHTHEVRYVTVNPVPVIVLPVNHQTPLILPVDEEEKDGKYICILVVLTILFTFFAGFYFICYYDKIKKKGLAIMLYVFISLFLVFNYAYRI